MDGENTLYSKRVDGSTVTGILVAFSLVVTAIFLGGNPQGFVDIRSVLIVVCGTFAVTIACFSFSEVLGAQGAMLRTIFYRSDKIKTIALNVMKLAEIARKSGLLELDKREDLIDYNPFLRDGVNMVIDQINRDEVSRVLDQGLDSLAYRHSKSVAVLRKAAEISPAMGLIGTLIGLVQMLGNLEDTSTIGPAMAVALLTTFYGAMLSYMFFSPLASKLERNTRDEMLVANICIQAVQSISRRESPRKLEMLLNSMLPPGSRINYKFSGFNEPIEDDVEVSEETASDTGGQGSDGASAETEAGKTE